MAKAFLSYTWGDNDDGDVEYVANLLVAAGLEIQIDRWRLGTGLRMWEQIERLIRGEENCDAFIIFATESSLKNNRCREEIAYALRRALQAEGEDFPIIGIFQGDVADAFIPYSISTRLYVSTNDDHWVERVVAACEGRGPIIPQRELHPYSLRVHPCTQPGVNYAIEVRPRAGVWVPFMAAVPAEERDRVRPNLQFGPKGIVPIATMLMQPYEQVSEDGRAYVMIAQNQCTTSISAYICCAELPSFMKFGVNQREPQFGVALQNGIYVHI